MVHIAFIITMKFVAGRSVLDQGRDWFWLGAGGSGSQWHQYMPHPPGLLPDVPQSYASQKTGVDLKRPIGVQAVYNLYLYLQSSYSLLADQYAAHACFGIIAYFEPALDNLVLVQSDQVTQASPVFMPQRAHLSSQLQRTEGVKNHTFIFIYIYFVIDNS